MNVTTLMRQSMRLNRDRPAVITEDRSFSFAEAWDRGVRVANGLRALGVKPGDPVAGAVRVPLYPRNSPQAHSHMIEGTAAKVVLADEALAGPVVGLDRKLGCLEHVQVRDAGYEQWLAAQDATDPMLEIGDDDWTIIRHSGGTTGRPKGVGYTHHDWVLNCRNWAYMLERMSRTSVVGHAGPISHASGYLFLPGWLAGAANLVFGAFEPGKVLEMMRRHRVSHMFASPSLLAALARHPRSE